MARTFPDPHDPDSTLPYTFTFQDLGEGVSIAGAELVEVVGPPDDADPIAAAVPVSSSDLTIGPPSVGQIDGNTWGVNFTPSGGTVGTVHWIRCRVSLSDTSVFDDTVGLQCEET